MKELCNSRNIDSSLSFIQTKRINLKPKDQQILGEKVLNNLIQNKESNF